MPGGVERQCGRRRPHLLDILTAHTPDPLQIGDGGIGAAYIAGVMLVVVQLHCLGVDIRLEVGVIVRQGRKLIRPLHALRDAAGLARGGGCSLGEGGVAADHQPPADGRGG